MKSIANGLSRICYDHGLGLFLIRITAGLIFLIHGAEKWQDTAGTIAMMAHFGWSPAVAYFIATLEVAGGIALILGVATRALGIILGIEMLVAVAQAGLPRGFHGYEFELLLAAVSFGLALAGAGKFSLWRVSCTYCGGAFCTGRPGACPR